MERIIRKNSHFEILTPDGWSDFDGISCQTSQSLYKLVTEKNEIICTGDHKLSTIDGLQFINKLKIGDTLVTKHGIGFIKEIYHHPYEEKVYDPIEVKKSHLYYANDIISKNCDFLGSSSTLIAGWKLKELTAKIPILNRDHLFKYADPIKGHSYVITVDVAEGKLRDYSCYQVTNITSMPYEQVATYRANDITPGDFAELIHFTAIAYNNALVLVEFENLGPEVSSQLFNTFDYENLLYTRSAGRSGKEITTSYGKGVDKGIKMSVATRATGCQMLKLLIEGNQYIVNDFHTIEELSTFSKKNNKYQAEEGKHDDTVMALLVFAWLSNDPYFKNLTNIDTIAKLKEKKTEELEDQLLPFGFVDRGPPVGSMPTTADLHRDLWYSSKKIQEYSPYVATNPDEDDKGIQWMPNF